MILTRTQNKITFFWTTVAIVAGCWLWGDTTSEVVNITAGSGPFPQILMDHPLDPDNKALRHFATTGPRARVVYEGQAQLNASGEAVVELPEYFDQMSRSGLVQLTPVAMSMPHLYYLGFENGRFTIKGGMPAGMVNWMVSAERNDPRARFNRVYQPVEDEKGAHGLPAKGDFFCPEWYNRKKSTTDPKETP